MTTELSFLVDLLLNHKLQPVTRKAIAERLKEVEETLSRGYPPPPAAVEARRTMMTVPPVRPELAAQAASTRAILERNPDLIPAAGGQGAAQAPAVVTEQAPVAVIAQTPATAQALQHRQEVINQALSGKPEKGRTSPRKF